MNNRLIPIVICIAAALSAGCSKEEAGTTGPLSVTVSTAAIAVSSEGGSYGFTYLAVNPGSDDIVVCSADVDWIGSLDWSQSGTVNFTVAENGFMKMRTGTVTLSYSSTRGSVTERVTVAQASMDGFSLVINPSSVTADIAGGTCSFAWAPSVSTMKGTLTCKCDETWIGDLDWSKSGTVSFTVDENTTGETRTGAISVTYTYSTGSISQIVSVAQIGSEDAALLKKYADLVGTYRASGKAYSGDNGAEETSWYLTIYADGTNGVYIDGMTPTTAGGYPNTEGYLAHAYLDDEGRLVVPTQWSGYTYFITGLYFGYTPCTNYVDGTGFYSNPSITDCTFTYVESNDTWKSDYGVFFALFSTMGDVSTMQGFLDVTAPEIVISKFSSSASSVGEGVGRSPVGSGSVSWPGPVHDNWLISSGGEL